MAEVVAVQVDGVSHFVNNTAGFLLEGNHFTLPCKNPSGETSQCQHESNKLHILTSFVKYYKDEMVYAIAFIRLRSSGRSDIEPGQPGSGSVDEERIEFKEVPDGGFKFLKGNEEFYKELEKGHWEMVTNSKYPQTEKERDDAVGRARSLVGFTETGFDSAILNGSSYVYEMLTGECLSEEAGKNFLWALKSANDLTKAVKRKIA